LSAEVDLNDVDRLAELFGTIAVRAGEVIMSARPQVCRPDYKADGTPVTAADLAADELIRDGLKGALPQLPVITEETCAGGAPIDAERFVLVDPLDGTKEFVKGSDEFTVNIAIIANGIPAAGAVYAPALHLLYVGGRSAYRLDTHASAGAVSFDRMQRVTVRPPAATGLRAVVSRSHLDAATKEWVAHQAITDLKPSGSSLKFCAVAEGEADVYPRLSPTMEWDTAAGQAVLLAAGGTVTDLTGAPLRYGKAGYRNGAFLAWGKAPGPAR
jgi:3'(2'), 5'-bisphosphate nucleotidase